LTAGAVGAAFACGCGVAVAVGFKRAAHDFGADQAGFASSTGLTGSAGVSTASTLVVSSLTGSCGSAFFSNAGATSTLFSATALLSTGSFLVAAAATAATAAAWAAFFGSAGINGIAIAFGAIFPLVGVTDWLASAGG